MPQPELIHYTITGAQDWPMFKEMLAGIRILVGALYAILIVLLAYIWHDLKKRIAIQRQEDQKAINREFGYLWGAIDHIAPRSSPAKILAEQKYQQFKDADNGG